MCCVRGSEVRARKAAAVLQERSHSYRYQILPMRLYLGIRGRLLRLGGVKSHLAARINKLEVHLRAQALGPGAASY
jgi:hypothetical protein